MFSKYQLELLQDILDGEIALPSVKKEDLVGLKGAVHSALWVSTRPLPRRDTDLVQRAIKDGRLQVCGPATLGEPSSVTRLRPRVLAVKSGAKLLAALNLKPKSDQELPSTPDEQATGTDG